METINSDSELISENNDQKRFKIAFEEYSWKGEFGLGKWFSFLDSWSASSYSYTIITKQEVIEKKNRENVMLYGIGYVPSRDNYFLFKALFTTYGGVRTCHWIEFARDNKDGKPIKKRLYPADDKCREDFHGQLKYIDNGDYFKRFLNTIQIGAMERLFPNVSSEHEIKMELKNSKK